MFINPEMRSIINKIEAIEEKYSDALFPRYTPADAMLLQELSAAYWDAKRRYDALITECHA